MKLAIVSDTHERVEEAKEGLGILGDFDVLFHAGDFYKDFLKLSSNFPDKIVAGVGGNCDPQYYPKSILIEILHYKIFLLHGHQYNVKMGLNNLKFAAMEQEADIVIFGHTHIPFKEMIEGILFFNPGSVMVTDGRSSIGFIELGIEEKTIDAGIINL